MKAWSTASRTNGISNVWSRAYIIICRSNRQIWKICRFQGVDFDISTKIPEITLARYTQPGRKMKTPWMTGRPWNSSNSSGQHSRKATRSAGFHLFFAKLSVLGRLLADHRLEGRPDGESDRSGCPGTLDRGVEMSRETSLPHASGSGHAGGG